ncbi:MAG: HD-GYP domain-containing protein [Thiohalomonadaceae bacterium]
MIKKIPIERLRVGMYIHDINCGWLDHPFLLNQLFVRDEKTLARVVRTGTREVYIDSERGLDVFDESDERPADEPVLFKPKEQVDRELLAELHRVIGSAPPSRAPRPVREELFYARSTAKEAKRVVSSVMHSVRAGRQFEVAEVEDVVEQLAESVLRNPQALIGLTRIRHRDHYTFEHSVSVAVFMLAFARALGFDEQTVRELGVGGLLHDIGKTRIPLHVLNKPGALTEEEYAVMREHVTLGRALLEEHGGIGPIAMAVVAEHHERCDGNGYPRQLKGEEISRYGQMAAIVDVYDAVTADRVYHTAEVPTRVLGQLIEWGAHHFSMPLVHQFIRCVGIYPVGSLVMLSNGWIGVVLEQGTQDLLHPRVRVVYDSRAREFMPPKDIDLATDHEYRIDGAASETRWGINGVDYLD